MQIIQRRILSSGSLSPPGEFMKHFVKELPHAPIPEIFLTGCSSAEPVSACFRQNKYIHILHCRVKIKPFITQCG